jgi:hypothetical protein
MVRADLDKIEPDGNINLPDQVSCKDERTVEHNQQDRVTPAVVVVDLCGNGNDGPSISW